MQIIATVVLIIAAILCVSSFKDEKKRTANLAACLFFMTFTYCVQFGVGDKSCVRAGGAALIVFLSLRLLFSSFISEVTSFKIQNSLKFYRGVL
ncbi:hypothetical protein [uncultured Campylobacter sp.]|uniref:hypothetical protein n=1 Tax=uncultured Campylobacter sp. TaxID=218934 RepID=UPI0026055F4F|nr:hypothetical protein [uncultured Campylobacter sp.]